uniref:CCHC-type domain-containing protein n=2 Tax=Tanacetum cinerariifolium TaxID=118510 RepID=A0A6L2LM97_TANCI|nr:hypothetical protein [Tanacetum cinerariifolium]
MAAGLRKHGVQCIYENENKKALTTVTPLSTAFFSTSIVQDFQDSPDDEEDTRSSQEYLNDLEEEYQARALLAKSKRLFKKGSQRFSSAKATKDTQCYKCGRNGHFARDCFSKTLVPSFPSPNQKHTQPRLTNSSHNKTESKDFEAKYNKVNSKLALLNPGPSASSSTLVKIRDLLLKPMNGMKRICHLMKINLFYLFSSTEETGDAEPVFGPKTVKTTLKSISTLKTEALKGIIPNEPSLASAQENKKASVSKSNSAPVENSKNVKTTDNLHLATKERSIQEILSIPLKDVKFVAVPSIPQLITMTLNGLKEALLPIFMSFRVINLNKAFQSTKKNMSSVNKWALKPNQPEGPPFTAHMVAICNAEKLVAFKAPRTFSQPEKKVSQGINPGAKPGHKKQSTSSKQPPMSSSEATKADGLTSLGVTSEERAHPQLSSGMLAFSNLKPIYSASVIIHSESSSGYNGSVDSTSEADPRTSTPNDSLPPQQGKDEGTKNYSLDHIFTGTDPNVLVDKTKSVSDGFETILTTPKTGTSNAAKPSEKIKFMEIKLEDLVKLVPNVKADFKDMDSLEDDPIIVVDDSEEDDKNEEIHSTANDETKDISASTPPSPRSIQL